jgi:hypothetical protein
MADMPDNAWTRMIERAAAINAESGGNRGIASALPRTTVTSAAMGREIPDAPPLSPEERDDLDRRARALGLLPPVESEEGPYATMEEALEAARGPQPEEDAPQMDPVEAMRRNARRMPRTPANTFQGPTREVQIIETPRLPDFTKPQGMDLSKGVAYLDGMEFAIPPQQLRKLRKFVVELARLSFMEKLEAATRLFESEAMDDSTGMAAAVQPVSEGGSKESA